MPDAFVASASHMARTRKIHFYSAQFIRFEDNEDGSGVQEISANLDLVFDQLRTLVWSHAVPAADSAYLPYQDDYLGLGLTPRQRRKAFGYFAISRRNDLPSMEQGGNFTPIPLPNDAGIGERSHFGLFWDGSMAVLAMEANVFAPRVNRLQEYLKTKLTGFPQPIVDDVVFTPIIGGDVLQRFLDAGQLASFDFLVARDIAADIARVARNNELGTALNALAGYHPEMVTIGVNIGRKRYARSGGAGDEEKGLIARIVRQFAPHIIRAKAQVEQDDTGVGPLLNLDLLDDKFASEVTLPMDGRRVNSNAMYQVVERAYRERESDLGVRRGN